RHVERLRGCEGRVFVAMLGGGAGTLASLGDLGLATQEKMAARLGMRPMPVPARTIGDHQAEYVTLLAMLAATCSKIGREIYTLMKQEFGEVEEPVPSGTVGSSTMPQKRNPKLSQDIVAAAAQIRALVPLALEAMQTEHEADRTTSIMMSRALVQACELTGDVLQRMISLFDGLQVFPDRMRENLELSGGLIMAEALMLELGKQIGRQRAHDAVYEAAQASVTQARSDLAGELLGEARLHHVRDRADGERRGLEEGLEVMAGQHDDRDGRRHSASLELADRGPAVELRHLQVHHDEVRVHRARSQDGLVPVLG